MHGRVIWDELLESIFENFVISKFSKMTRVIYPKNRPNHACGYWLITPNQQTLCAETNIIQQKTITNQQVGNSRTAGVR